MVLDNGKNVALFICAEFLITQNKLFNDENFAATGTLIYAPVDGNVCVYT